MLLSVFTPTHDPKYLGDCLGSLRSQTFQDWEWVVVPNGPRTHEIVAWFDANASGDPRIRVILAPVEMTGGVGALKRLACENCKGDVFVEYDHDDLLTTDCLAAVAERAELNPFAFIYSDDITCGFDGTEIRFDPRFGWQSYEVEVGGRKIVVNRTPDAHPRTVCEILYAPDHVRAWTREAYTKAGGHNPNLTICDDHELMVKSYLAGAEFVHIPRPLYTHRVDQTRTSRLNMQAITIQSGKIRDENLPGLVKEWCRRDNLMMLDLGGAHGCPEGYKPVDKHLPGGVGGYRCDVFDLIHHVPFGKVGCIRAVDFLEHIPIGKVVPLMNMLYKLLAPGGFLLTQTPAVADLDGKVGLGAFQDPTHVSYWSKNNTWYFTKRQYARYVPEIVCRFQSVRVATGYISDWHKENGIPYLLWDAMAIKDGPYLPGPKEI